MVPTGNTSTALSVTSVGPRACRPVSAYSVTAYETKFGKSSTRFKLKIGQINDRDKLKELLRIILKIQDMKELENCHIWS